MDAIALNEDLSKVNIQVQSNTSTNDIDVNEIYENLLNKLKRKSENNYFQERCTGGCKQTEFWKTMKPYFSKKSCGTQSKIILQDNDKIVTKNVDVAEVFNKFFVNVAQDIGKDYTFNKNDHPSLQKIEDKNFVKNSFEFKSTNETFVSKVIDKFNVKKATGVDKISVKLMKLGKISLLSPITKIINMSIDSGIFPNRLKEAQVTPILKKNDPF